MPVVIRNVLLSRALQTLAHLQPVKKTMKCTVRKQPSQRPLNFILAVLKRKFLGRVARQQETYVPNAVQFRTSKEFQVT